MESSALPSTRPCGDGAFDLVVMAASAGGVEALSTVMAGLPGSFPASIGIVQHLEPHRVSAMVEILQRRTSLEVVQPVEGQAIEPGWVYIAPPDRHVIVNPDRTLSLSDAPKAHFVRPAADLLFESAAAALGEKVVAVVLSGSGLDGTSGVRAVKQAGGTVIVQDPKTAAFSGMPGSALRTGAVDLVLPLDEIADALTRLVTVHAEATGSVVR